MGYSADFSVCTNLCTHEYLLKLSQLSGFNDILSVLCCNKRKKMHGLVKSAFLVDCKYEKSKA